ncbi:MAG: hypothetical protein Q9205_002136 [Flavoplaca limonia]
MDCEMHTTLLERAAFEILNSVKDWPESIAFRVTISGANPPAHLNFLRCRAEGTSEEATNFARAMDEEIDYLQRRRSREGPRERILVARPYTDVALQCRWPNEGHPNWSFELWLLTLRTLGGLARLNGLKEFEFEVQNTSNGGVYQICEIYLRNPFVTTDQ